jgi:sortase A
MRRVWLASSVLALALMFLAGCSGRERTGQAPPPPSSRTFEVVAVDGPVAPLAPPSFANVSGQPQLPSRLEIPAIAVDTPVVELGWSTQEDAAGRIFSEWDVAEFAAGWHLNSAQPGEGGNVVMSGHNNVAGAVFRELDQLRKGHEAFVYAGNARYTYVIDKVMVVPDKAATLAQRQANAQWIGDFTDDRLTLVSCWPRDDNTHRIIVVAYREDNATAVVNE